MSKELEALEKLNHTFCLNSPTIKWGIDTYDHIDCKDEKEFVKCYNIIKQALEQKAKQEETIKEENTIKCLINFIDGLQQKYLRENRRLPNAILMPRWAYVELKKESEKRINIIKEKQTILTFLGLEIIPTTENEFILVNLCKGEIK